MTPDKGDVAHVRQVALPCGLSSQSAFCIDWSADFVLL